jgi:nucleoside-diphosphate-sugar epimerase
MVALVTGASGLLGSHVMRQLMLQGHSVIGLSQSENSASKAKLAFEVYNKEELNLYNQIAWKHGDINDTTFLYDILAEVDWVFHCAAIVSFEEKDKEKMEAINVEGTANLVNMSLLRNIKKFCHVSSVAALGKTKNDLLIDENTLFVHSPDNSNYGISKYGAEQEVWRGAEEGLTMVIVNPTVIIGPGDWKTGSSNLFTSSAKGMKFYSDGVTGFTDVRDVAAIMVQLTAANFKNERYVICAENLPYKQVFDWMHQAFNKKLPWLKASALAGAVVWRLEKFISFFTNKKPLITKETVSAAFQKVYFSNAKVVQALQYKFIPIKETIENTAAIYKQQNTQ